VGRGRLIRIGSAALLVLAVAAASAWLGLEGPAPRDDVMRWLTLLGGSTSALVAAGLLVSSLPRREAVIAILAGAVVLRAGALAAPVSLSDDIERYVWDGAVLANGMDPYAHYPEDLVGAGPGLDEARLERLNSPRYYTIYPPLAQAAFGAAALTEPTLDGALALRVIFAAFDVLAVWALLGLLARLRRAPGWALLYAWCPLVYWEVAAGGHTEALMTPLLLLGVNAALDGEAPKAAVFVALAASAKLTALVAGPLIVIYLAHRVGLGRALASLALGAAAFALGFAPFASETLIPHLRESAMLFSGRFSFNAPVYYALRDSMGYVEGLRPDVDWMVMPALAAATLLWLALMAFVQDGSRRRFVAGLAFSFLGLLLLARVAHPWYLLPALALGVAARSPTLALASVLLPLSYLRYEPFDREEPMVLALQFVPILITLLVEGAVRLLARSPATTRVDAPDAEASRPRGASCSVSATEGA